MGIVAGDAAAGPALGMARKIHWRERIIAVGSRHLGTSGSSRQAQATLDVSVTAAGRYPLLPTCCIYLALW